jgi:hypothetical protein
MLHKAHGVEEETSRSGNVLSVERLMIKRRGEMVGIYEVQSIEHGLKSEIHESDEKNKESNSLPHPQNEKP